MAKGHNKQKNTKDEQVMDGLGVSFEDAMKVFAQPVHKPKSDALLQWEETIKDSHLFVKKPQLPKISLIPKPESQSRK